MIMKFVVDKPLLELNCILGEGCVWDTRIQRLYFVDIDQYKLYTYEPSSGKYGYETFDKKVSALASLESGEGLIAAVEDGFAYISFDSLPFPPTSSKQSLIPIPSGASLNSKEKRFNDGAVDPAGRFLAGTLGFEHGSKDGKMYSLQVEKDGSYSVPLILDGITCTNGMGWTEDAKTVYFSDSWIKEIAKFDYDITTGKLSNGRVFSNIDGYGEPDGMCMDSEGGIWTCRWASEKILRLTPDGEIDVEIDFPTA
ncbi:regucalcin [Cryptococcus neoformans]|nr:regucalcin [Cryptococcus neoformans var. grubii]OXC57779.1 regucalcin [Cryptococcus neoformans var. grubii MW-RSA852]